MRFGGCGCSGFGASPDGIGAYHRDTNDAAYQMPLEAVGAEPEDGDTGALFDSYWDEAQTTAALSPQGITPGPFVSEDMFTNPSAYEAPPDVIDPVTGRVVGQKAGIGIGAVLAVAGVAAALLWLKPWEAVFKKNARKRSSHDYSVCNCAACEAKRELLGAPTLRHITPEERSAIEGAAGLDLTPEEWRKFQKNAKRGYMTRRRGHAGRFHRAWKLRPGLSRDPFGLSELLIAADRRREQKRRGGR